MIYRLCLLPLLLLPSTPSQLGLPDPLAAGFVTAVDTADTFRLEGVVVRIEPKAIFRVETNGVRSIVVDRETLYPGELIRVDGKKIKGSKELSANTITIVRSAGQEITGLAIIDQVPPTNTAAGQKAERVLRADGYLLRLTTETSLKFTPPLLVTDEVTTNLWIAYKGTRQLDGSVRVQHATLSRNVVESAEQKVLRKDEFDPAAVTPGDRQGKLSKSLRGLDPKRVAAAKDPVVQARVERIGRTLIPRYQRDLPRSEPSRIDFRFQVVDLPKAQNVIVLGNGIILVPEQMVSRLPIDGELAALLAGGVAEAIEKDEVRLRPVSQVETAANVVAIGAGFVVPGLALAGALESGNVTEHVRTLQRQQRDRVSLFLLQDAGYDPGSAPLAWWRLASPQGKPLETIKLPAHASYLYGMLGTNFQPGEVVPRELEEQHHP